MKYLFILFSLLVIFYYNNDAITSEILSGWDYSGHYYILTKAILYIEHFKLSGYDPNWYGGMPMFSLYPIGSYLPLAFLALILKPIVSSLTLLNISFFLFPFLYIASALLFAKSFIGKKLVFNTFLVAFIYLMIGKENTLANLSLSSLYIAGLYPNNVSFPFLLLYLVSINEFYNKQSKKWLFYSTLFLIILFYTHILHSVFAVFLTSLYLAFHNFKYFKKYLLVLVSSICLSLPWIIEIIKHLPYSSGQSLGFAYGPLRDVFFFLYPGIKYSYIEKNIFSEPENIKYIHSFFGKEFDLFINPMFSEFPFGGILFLLFGALGIIYLIRQKKYFLPYTFILCFALVPRNIFTEIFPISIHYYRFIPVLIIFNFCFAAVGIEQAFLFCRKTKIRLIGSIVKISLYSFLSLSIINASLFSIDWTQAKSYQGNPNSNTKYYLNAAKTPWFYDANRMIDYIAKLNPKGRVVIENTVNSVFLYGSPHYFTAMLPIKYNIAVFPGLLAESSISSSFVNPVVTSISKHFSWGRQKLSADPVFMKQDIKFMLDRLRLYECEYFLTTSSSFSLFLEDEPQADIVLEKQIGGLKLYRIKDEISYINEISYKPFLFIDRGGIDFRLFSESWYRYPELLDTPIVYTEIDYDNLPKSDRESFGGIIVSFPKGHVLTKKEYKYWSSKNSNVYFVNVRQAYGEEKGPYLRVESPDILRPEFINALTQNQETRKVEDYKLDFNQNEKIEFVSNKPTVIKYSYAPRWKVIDSTKILYQATPSFMFVFGKGKTTLEYQ